MPDPPETSLSEPKELLWASPTLPDSTLPQPSTSTSTSSIRSGRSGRKRWTKKITSLPYIGRLLRITRTIIGPNNHPTNTQIPPPQPSLSINLTIGHRSFSSGLNQPLTAFNRRFHLHHLLYPFLLLWATMMVLLIRQQYYVPGPTTIGCTAAPYDSWPPDVCGVNGTACESALEEGTYRCLGGCLDVTLGNPRWIGGQEIDDVPMVIGGGDGRYRADSWVCPAAIHAGLISRTLGGCVTLRPFPFDSTQSNFIGTKSNGVDSTSFIPDYPGAYELIRHGTSGCLDIHPIVSTVNAICLLLVTLFLSPSPSVLYIILVLLGYVQIVMFSDPPNTPPYWEIVLGHFGPILFASYFFWKVSFKRTLEGFKGLPVEIALWQGIGYWIGIESSTIFSKLPIDRLGYGALSPSGVIALIVIIVVVLIIVLIQAWQMRKVGLLQYYLIRYIWLVPLIIILIFIPDHSFRLHHWILATAAIPVLSLPNRVSLLGQALTLGIFLDGAGRWGMASILEHTASLLGDAAAGTGTPTFLPNMSSLETISWWPLTPALLESGYNGISIIIDDILRVENVTTSNYTFGGMGLGSGMDHFFRLAFEVNGTVQDYTDPIALFLNGTWAELS